MRGLANLVPLLLLGLLFYVLLIRPQRNRQRQAQELISRVSPGDRVVTSAGLFGTVAEVEADSVSLEVSPGVRMRFVKSAISRIVTSDVPVTDAAGLDAADDREFDDDEPLPGQEPVGEDGYRQREQVVGSELAGSSYPPDESQPDPSGRR